MKYFAGGHFALQLDAEKSLARWVGIDHFPHNWQPIPRQTADNILSGSLKEFEVSEAQFKAITTLWGTKFND